MGGFKLEIKGLQAVVNKLSPKKFDIEVKSALDDFGGRWRDAAIEFAPTDEGHLRLSINYEIEGEKGRITVSLNANTNYAAYVEFGTRKFAAQYVATLPADWQTFAAQFKGKGGGDYFEFLNAILDWVIRKGIANRYSVKTQQKIDINVDKPSTGKEGRSDYDRLHDAAYAIALSILRNGIKPHPFMFPAIVQETPLLLEDLKALLK